MRFRSVSVALQMATLLLCARMAWPQAPAEPIPPPATPADLAAGERIYRTQVVAFVHTLG